MMDPAPRPRKLCKRYNTPWQAHYLTFSCLRRQPFFRGRRTPVWFLESLDTARRKEAFDLWAFVIMPEHVHLLIAPGGDYDIGRILSRIKGPMSHRALSFIRANHPDFLPKMTQTRPSGKTAQRFWQPGGGYDRNLWTGREIHEKIHYIHANPVRRGLVERAEDWHWSSGRAWAEGVDEPLRIDRGSVPPLVT